MLPSFLFLSKHISTSLVSLRSACLCFALPPPCPLPTQPPSWHLLSTHLKPTCGDGGWQCPFHPKAPNAKASSFLLADPPGR